MANLEHETREEVGEQTMPSEKVEKYTLKQEIDRQSHIISSLGDAISELSSMLSPIIVKVPEECDSDVQKRNLSSEFGNEICRNNENLRLIISNVDSIIASIEL